MAKAAQKMLVQGNLIYSMSSPLSLSLSLSHHKVMFLSHPRQFSKAIPIPIK